MSNVKRVYAEGFLPYDCTGNDEVRNILGVLNGPVIGIHVRWTGKKFYKPTENGGKYAQYQFVIQGDEAISWTALQEWANTLRKHGQLEMFRAADIEDGMPEPVDL